MGRMVRAAAIALVLGISGCASTQEAKSVEKSGFLGDYSLLKEGQRSAMKQGPEDEALLIYKNPAFTRRADPWPRSLNPCCLCQRITSSPRKYKSYRSSHVAEGVTVAGSVVKS